MSQYIIVDSGDNLVWESEESNQIENYDQGIDALLLIQFKSELQSFPIPDNLLYMDYYLNHYEPDCNCFLYEKNNSSKEMKQLFDSKTIFQQVENPNIKYKIDEIEAFIENHYHALFDFSEILTNELKSESALKHLYPIANEQSYQSKAAQFIIHQINGNNLDRLNLIDYYDGIDKAVNVIGNLLMDIQSKQN